MYHQSKYKLKSGANIFQHELKFLNTPYENYDYPTLKKWYLSFSCEFNMLYFVDIFVDISLEIPISLKHQETVHKF
jgi:hypothetical protein